MEIVAAVPASREKQIALGLMRYQPDPDALEMRCQACGIAVLVGPQAVRKLCRDKAMPLLCVGCARGGK